MTVIEIWAWRHRSYWGEGVESLAGMSRMCMCVMHSLFMRHGAKALTQNV